VKDVLGRLWRTLRGKWSVQAAPRLKRANARLIWFYITN